MPIREKLAVPLEGTTTVVVLDNGDRMKRTTAKAQGYKIFGEPDAVEPNNETTQGQAAHASWRSAVLLLPEARDREAAAAEIANNHTEHTMPVANARAFLRGLPTEQTQEETATMTTNVDTNPERTERLAEIQSGMKAFNKGRGYSEPRVRSAQTATSLSDVEPAKLKRLAEIRLNALESNSASEASTNETKKLRYAMQVHAETGMPLLNVFSQLNVDTSKLNR
jgi:hypothetical protein